MRTAIDWESKPEPQRSRGLAWVATLRAILGPPAKLDRAELPDRAGLIIFARRRALKLTTHDLESYSGVPRGTISDIELGKSASPWAWRALEKTLTELEKKRDTKSVAGGV